MTGIHFVRSKDGMPMVSFAVGTPQFTTMWPTVWTKPFRITEVPGEWIGDNVVTNPVDGSTTVYVSPVDTLTVAAPAGPQPESSVGASGQQPLPVDGDENVTDWLVEQLRERTRRGIETYGKPLQTFNGRDALWDAFEEAMDLCQYLAQALMERNHITEALQNARG